MVELADGQYEVDGLRLGDGTPYRVLSHEDGGVPERRTQDVERAYGDGLTFGRDMLTGPLHEFELQAESAGGGESWDTVGEFVTVWRGDAVRLSPGSVQALRMKRPGRPTHRVYGRTRKATPVRSRGTGVGLVPIVATFKAVDDRYYSDAQSSTVVQLRPSSVGGIITEPGGGIVSPITTAQVGATEAIIVNGGDADTYGVVTLYGPNTNPSLELRHQGAIVWTLAFGYTLAEGQTVTVDCRPWARTVLRENGAPIPGKRTRKSTPLEDCVIPPGRSELILRGTSVTGSAEAEVVLRDAWPAG